MTIRFGNRLTDALDSLRIAPLGARGGGINIRPIAHLRIAARRRVLRTSQADQFAIHRHEPFEPPLKSRFVTGVQCHKLLWWTVHEAEAKELQPDKVLQDLFDQGRQVGEVARTRYPTEC